MKRIKYGKGDTIFTQGTESDVCYKILKGTVEIYVHDAETGTDKTVAVCHEGEIIGEMGVLGNAPRSASARALEPSICKSYAADEIISLLSDEPQEALAYVRTLIQRIRHANSKAFFPARTDTWEDV